MEGLLSCLLGKLEVGYTHYHLRQELDGHPYADTLYAVVDVLRGYGIKSLGIRNEERNLHALSVPSVAVLRVQEETLLTVVTDIQTDSVDYYIYNKAVHAVPQDFCHAWTGEAVVLTDAAQAHEPSYGWNFIVGLIAFAERVCLSALPLLVILAGLFVNFSRLSVHHAICLFLNTIGATASFVMIRKRTNQTGMIVHRLCTLSGNDACKRTSSLHVPLFDYLPLDIIGLGYFTAHAIQCVLVPQALSSALWVSLATLPASFACIVILIRRRLPCTFCIVVQLALWANFINESHFMRHRFPTFDTFVLILYSALIFFLICMIHLRLMYEDERDRANRTLAGYRRFKTDHEVLQNKLWQGIQADTDMGESSIVFGNREARTRITIITNPFCEACAQTHREVESLLARCDGGISIQYIFVSRDEAGWQACRFLISTYKTCGEVEFRNILNQWFKYGRFRSRAFMKQRGVSIDEREADEILQTHAAWRRRYDVNFTPCTFIDGYRLPPEYDFEDIEHLYKKT